jgi:hypothetical protein
MTGIPEKSDWARPPGCDCFTWAQHERCYENCEPVVPGAKKLILWPAAVITIIALALIFFIDHKLAHGAGDPYECFGAGRYDAMSRGFDETDCPKPGQEFDDIDGHYRYPLGHVAWRMPNYCDALKLMDRSCVSVKAVARMYGRYGAERRARACGASDSDIAQANTCFPDPK